MNNIRLFFNKKENLTFNIAVVILFALLFTHIIGLDRDLPSFGLGLYMSRDEGQYSQMAIKLYNNGSIFHANGLPVTTSPTFRSNILGNLMQYISFNIVGDNYYGLRIPYFIFSFLVVFFTYKVILLLAEQNSISIKYTKWFVIIMLLYYNISFPFMLMSRVAENSSLRSLSLIFFLYVWLKYKDKYELKCFLFGLLSILSLLCLYFSNITLLCTLGLFVMYKTIYAIRNNGLNKDLLKFYFYSFFGAIIGDIIAEIYYLSVWKEEAWHNFFGSIFSYSKRIVVVNDIANEESTGGYVKNIVKGGMRFLSSNIFLFSIILGVLFFTAIVINVFSKKDNMEKKETVIIAVSIQILFAMQCVFTNDYTERKVITILPVIIVSIYLAGECLYNNKVSKLIKGICVFFSWIMIPGIIYSIIWDRRTTRYNRDFSGYDIKILKTCIILECIVIVSVPVFSKIKKKVVPIILLCLIGIVSNLYFDIKYVYAYDSYTEKNAMIGIGEIANGEYVAGPYAYGYALYNNIYPVMNWDTRYEDEIADGTVKYLCDYASGVTWVDDYSEENYVLVKSFNRALLSWGSELKIALFKKMNE